jgi:hypothetical protein
VIDTVTRAGCNWYRCAARAWSRGSKRSACAASPDLRGDDPFDLMERVNLGAGYPIRQPPMATRALENPIAAAEHEVHEE